MDLIREGLKSHSDILLSAGLYAAQGKSFDKELILGALRAKIGLGLNDLGDLPEKMQISISDIYDWLNSSGWGGKANLAVKACVNKDVPLEWLFEAAENNFAVRDAVVDVLKKKKPSARMLKQYWSKYVSQRRRDRFLYILGICAGRDDVKSIICEGVESWIGNAPEACRGVNFSLPEIDEWRKSASSAKRAAAMYASIGRQDVPDEWIVESLDDAINSVEYAARLAREGRNFPPIRDFEPPEEVYKYCLDGVEVIASIPADAEIRGELSGKARANKALIVGIEGDFYGEKVGVSMFDKQTLYRVGDEVFIPDFDPGDNEWSTGFYFLSLRP